MNIPAVVASVAGSTCAVDYPALPGIIQAVLEARAARAEAVTQRNVDRAAEARETRAQKLHDAVLLIARPMPAAWTVEQRARAVHRRLRTCGYLYALGKRPPTLVQVLDVLNACTARTGRA